MRVRAGCDPGESRGVCVTEIEIQAAIVAAAKTLGYKVYRLNAGGRRNYHGQEAGTPDLLVIMGRGRTLFVEVKRGAGQPTEVQKQRHRELRKLGHAVVVARSVEDFIQAEREVRESWTTAKG